MTTIGLDFGASRLRVAGDGNGSIVLMQHRYVSERMPFVVDFSGIPDGDAQPRCRITSLKRMLDFNKAFPIPPTEMNSMNVLAEMLGVIRAECQGNSLCNEVNCVMAVPPCFSQRQRSALRTTVAQARFPRIRLLDDTLAALLACMESVRGCERILVYSWGASAFSAALYQPKGSGFRALAQDGDRDLGGDDLDAVVADVVLAALAEQVRGALPADDLHFLRRVVAESERAKLTLATGGTVSVPLTRIFGENVPSALRTQAITVPRQIFDHSVARMMTESLELVEKVLGAGGCLKPDAVLTIGGMTLLPAVEKGLEDRFQVPITHADEGAAAIGAVLYGRMLTQAEWEKSDRPIPGGEEKQLGGDDLSPSNGAAGHMAGRAYREAERSQRWANNFTPLIDSAQQQYEEGCLGEAIGTFEKLFGELIKYSGELYRGAAAALDAAGNSDEAIRVLKKSNQRDPSNRLVAVDLARTCYRRAAQGRSQKESAAAAEIIRQGVDAIRSLSDGDTAYAALLAQLLHLKGCALCDQGRLAEAELEIAESTRLDPKNEAYQKDLATIRASIKKMSPNRLPPPGRVQVGRNDRCPCGSGRKYKRCCGKGV